MRLTCEQVGKAHFGGFIPYGIGDNQSDIQKLWHYLTAPVRDCFMDELPENLYEQILSAMFWMIVYARYNGVPPNDRYTLDKPTMSPSELREKLLVVGSTLARDFR